jgi:hypothetical protein
MKVKALIDCTGLGYALKAEETAVLNKKLAEKLIKFNYVEEAKQPKAKETKVKK